MNYAPAPQPIFYHDRKVTRVAIKDIERHRQEQGAFGFVGVDDHYFLSAIVPPAEQLQVSYSPIGRAGAGAGRALQFISWSVRSPSAPLNADFFFGPKDLDVLQSIKPDLVRAIDFGMFDLLVVPLLRALKWVNSYVGNYGWSIIVLTIIINLVMFPLKHKSIVSMRKMQELQPQMKAIQDRYAKLKMTDPGRQKMNEEVMALYKRERDEPCVGLRAHAAHDAGAGGVLCDAGGRHRAARRAVRRAGSRTSRRTIPYFVTPVLMGITMFVQQKMTPAVADPVQAKMMMFMPLMFTGMLMWAPSGLVLYWTASNIWAIGQQTLTNRLIGPPPQHNVRPPAERQIKNAGGGQVAAGEGAEVMDLHGRVREFSSGRSAPWECRSRSRSRTRRTASVSTCPARAAKCCCSGAARRSTRSSTSSTPPSGASSTATARSSSIASATARARMPSCSRWRASAWRRSRRSGAAQEIGPLNPYARRLVHITVAEDPQMTSESIGDAFLKTVIISLRR